MYFDRPPGFRHAVFYTASQQRAEVWRLRRLRNVRATHALRPHGRPAKIDRNGFAIAQHARNNGQWRACKASARTNCDPDQAEAKKTMGLKPASPSRWGGAACGGRPSLGLAAAALPTSGLHHCALATSSTDFRA